MLTELKYRTFDDLLASVKLDLKTYHLEGMIETPTLIKVAIRINYELGLKINMSKSKVLEVHKGKARLPADFDVLNFALLCENPRYLTHVKENTKTYTEGLLEGAALIQQFGYLSSGNSVRQYNTTKNILPGVNIINHNLDTTSVIVQAVSTDGNFLSYILDVIDENTIHIISAATVPVNGVQIVVMGASQSRLSQVSSAELTTHPDGSNSVVYYNVHGKRCEFTVLTPIRIEKSKSVTPDCLNLNSKDFNVAHIKNNFIVTNFESGELYINYQSLMEDDDGNLLVLDHPLANEFYEYALKQRIFENMLMAGEPVTNMLQLVEQRLRAARNNAYNFIRTPDFNELRKVWEMNRKAQYYTYYNMFKSSL
jgi:hypothetical protein